jgi:hypothetical protein
VTFFIVKLAGAGGLEVRLFTGFFAIVLRFLLFLVFFALSFFIFLVSETE